MTMDGNEARPCRLSVRISDEEADALTSAPAAYGVTKTGLVRLLVRYLQLPSKDLLSGEPIAFDRMTSSGIADGLRSVGTLYNRQVRALNTMAKGIREGEAGPEDVLEALLGVHAAMPRIEDELHLLRLDVSSLADSPTIFTW